MRQISVFAVGCVGFHLYSLLLIVSRLTEHFYVKVCGSMWFTFLLDLRQLCVFCVVKIKMHCCWSCIVAF